MRFSPFARIFPQSPTDLNSGLKNANGADFRKTYGEYIEKYGGLYNPGFITDNIFDENQEKGWSKLLGIIKPTPTQENTLNVIKSMKAKKQLMETVLSNKNKDFLLQNENILK